MKLSTFSAVVLSSTLGCAGQNAEMRIPPEVAPEPAKVVAAPPAPPDEEFDPLFGIIESAGAASRACTVVTRDGIIIGGYPNLVARDLRRKDTCTTTRENKVAGVNQQSTNETLEYKLPPSGVQGRQELGNQGTASVFVKERTDDGGKTTRLDIGGGQKYLETGTIVKSSASLRTVGGAEVCFADETSIAPNGSKLFAQRPVSCAEVKNLAVKIGEVISKARSGFVSRGMDIEEQQNTPKSI